MNNDAASTLPYPDGLYTVQGIGWRIATLKDFDAAAFKRYKELGYVIVDEAFSAQQIQDAKDALDAMLAGAYPEFNGIQFEEGADGDANSTPDVQRVRRLMGFTPFDARFRAVCESPPLMSVLQQIIGEPVRLFQDMALLKPPHGGREKPWHQDHAYFDYPLETKVVGVWIALDEATVENGCMHLIPGSHLQGPGIHFMRRDWQICDSEILGSACITAPLKPGGALLFDGLLKHGTPANTSAKRRRALQFHYRASSAQKTTEADRLRVFGSEGSGVTC